jgi:MFS family permease
MSAADAATDASAVPPPGPDVTVEPTRLLPLGQLLRLSVYWLGLVAVFQGIGLIMQERIKDLVPDESVQYTTLGFVQMAGVAIAVLIQPTVGSISDYTISRFGRRKPFILIGTTLDLVFLIGIATSNSIVAIAALVVLLQFSSNFAQGPFQGYVPDMVPAPQVGLASGMVGLFTVLGVVFGSAMASLGLVLGDFRGPTILLGIVEFLTMLSLFYRLDEGRVAKDRNGRSWRAIAAEAWGTDILRERSFIHLVGSRFFILGGSAFLIALAVPYLERALGMADPDDRAVWILAITGIAALCTAIATIPAARLSQRYGRKRLIYVACATSATGMVICAFAPSVWFLVLGASLVGIGGGSFLAVDWALMTDIIPKASAGRFMGISNVATATNGVVAGLVGYVIVDRFAGAGATDLGPRAAFLLAPVWYLIGAWLLRPVDERRREDDPSLLVESPIASAASA